MKKETRRCWLTDDGRVLLRETGNGDFRVNVIQCGVERLRDLYEAIGEILEDLEVPYRANRRLKDAR